VDRLNDSSGELVGWRPPTSPEPKNHSIVGSKPNSGTFANYIAFLHNYAAITRQDLGLRFARDPQEDTWYAFVFARFTLGHDSGFFSGSGAQGVVWSLEAGGDTADRSEQRLSGWPTVFREHKSVQ